MVPLALSAAATNLGEADMGVIAIQEVRRTAAGWTTEQVGKYTLLSHQFEGEWRGTGILYDAVQYAVLRRLCTTKGTWFRLRHLDTRAELWVGSVYLAPHLCTLDMQQYLIELCDKLPATLHPVYLAGDTNAPLKWLVEHERVSPFGLESKPRTLLDTLHSYGFQIIPPREDQTHCPTSRPRKAEVEGRVIDWIACKRARCQHIQVCVDSSKGMGADHDCLLVSTSMETPMWKPERRIKSGRRAVRSTPTLPPLLNQKALEEIAHRHTGPPPKATYKEDRGIRALFRTARQSRDPRDWKQAFRARREGYRRWKESQVMDAVEGSWHSYRQLKSCTNVGWEAHLAEHLQPQDPHVAVHEHYSNIFKSDDSIQARSVSPPPSEDITTEELERALSLCHKGRSVGKDGVSVEILQAIAEIPEGKFMLVEYFNELLHSGDLPPQWLDTLMVLLPKVRVPKLPRDTRPISMGSAVEKLFCRVVLERCKKHLQLSAPWQCAGAKRQTCDFLYTIQRLCDMEREWNKGLCLLKIDFRRAFDTVNRDKMMQALYDRLGNTEEFRVWEFLMAGTSSTLRSPWGQSSFSTSIGIRQGAIESPIFFGLLVEWALTEISISQKWEKHVSMYKDLFLTQTAFMDDLLAWDGSTKNMQKKFDELRKGFAEWGLQINAEKCSLYLSPKHEGPAFLTAGDVILQPKARIEVMGVPFRVGAGCHELLQATWQKARNKFWAMKHLLITNTPIGKRLKLLDRVIGGTALWNIAAFPPDHTTLTALNHMMLQFALWMLRLRKHAGETWTAYRQRGFRQARQLICLNVRERWSTQWLSRFWGFSGHVARGMDLQSPPSSSIICFHRTSEWWEMQKLTVSGLRHSGRFFPKMTEMDKKMNAVAGGPWRTVARDRVKWKGLANDWIQQQDVPWASGQQFMIEW